ncbi:MAG: ABC transporter ATP-binding protein [Pelolinea sp.]|nr:ABC transporter ATP-binding protein [Pelolinea sp.]
MLDLRQIEKEYDGQPLLNGLSFSVGKNETVCILGPSGVGKSTLLRIIAGLEQPADGEVIWNNKDISDLPPYKRKFGLMFQDYALFPHLDVFENVAFGLRMQHIPHIEIEKRVSEALEMVNLRHIARRSVTDLSGGEKQRIAFARALAPKPKLLMLDEPMGSLDRALRDQLTRELHILLGEMDIPVIYVTHDQEEAFSIADKLLILNEGRIVQSGSPQYVYTHPSDPWVASFFGLNNRLHGKIISSDPAVVKTDIGEVTISCVSERFSHGELVDVVILPTAVKMEVENQSQNIFTGKIVDSLFKGNSFTTQVKIGSDAEFTFEIPEKLSKGDQVTFTIDPDAILCFGRKD